MRNDTGRWYADYFTKFRRAGAAFAGEHVAEVLLKHAVPFFGNPLGDGVPRCQCGLSLTFDSWPAHAYALKQLNGSGASCCQPVSNLHEVRLLLGGLPATVAVASVLDGGGS